MRVEPKLEKRWRAFAAERGSTVGEVVEDIAQRLRSSPLSGRRSREVWDLASDGLDEDTEPLVRLQGGRAAMD